MNPYQSPPAALTPEHIRGAPPEVEIEYDVTFADVITFAAEDFHRQRGWLDLWIVLVLAGIAIMEFWPVRWTLLRDPRLLLLEPSLSTRLIALTLSGLIVAGLLRLAYRLGAARILMTAIAYATALLVGRGRMVGAFRCRASATEVTEYTASKPYTFPIASVRSIKVTPQHIGLRMTLSHTVVIPRRAFATTEAVDAFVAALEAYTGKSAQYLQPR